MIWSKIPRHVHKQLPKPPLLAFEWWPGSRLVNTVRMASCRHFHIGPLVVVVRAPWLAHAARIHHPQLFNNERYSVDEEGRTGWTIR